MHIFDHVDGILPIEMKAEMIDGKRYYVTPTGGKYPSITTVISNNAKKQAGLAKWRARVGKEKAQAKTTRGCNRGTRYHKLVEDYINNELDTKKYKDMPLPWTMFHSSREVLDRINRVYLQEAALYSDYLQIAGRVDCIAEYEWNCLSLILRQQKPPRRNYIFTTISYKNVAMHACYRKCMV